ncbi:hypothetical protein [Grimontia sp. NTOU-MAR1]|uniref:hypothetical protein n=1 Tax=Grimontia sp. NTOU-MAR1 TaxID=3111011 RepID=UPI002DB682D7|nr:hypothetical protein [Grimontia sp. NTOU-MAR1]WRV97588.1 hypothetical protein VP504_16360 [Grimontia sp. NTOU-MAR1]
MKLYFVSVTALFFALLLAVLAPLSLKDALTANAITTRLDSFSQHPNQPLHKNDEQLMEAALASSATAHQLNSIVLFDQWMSYLEKKDETYLDSQSLMQTSTHIRPTWSNTYVELAKLSESKRERDRYIHLASLFGPYAPSSRLLMIEDTFTKWEKADLDEQVLASKHLVSLARIWRHREALETMISYSSAKQRMCNLLAFNTIRVKACV